MNVILFQEKNIKYFLSSLKGIKILRAAGKTHNFSFDCFIQIKHL